MIGANANNVDVVTVAVLVVGALLSVIGAMSLIIFNSIRREIHSLHGQVLENGRHVASLLYEWRIMGIRVSGVEDHLVLKDAYRPPKVMSEHD